MIGRFTTRSVSEGGTCPPLPRLRFALTIASDTCVQVKVSDQSTAMWPNRGTELVLVPGEVQAQKRSGHDFDYEPETRSGPGEICVY